MSEPSPIERWRRQRAVVSRAEFQSQHPYAFLVWSAAPLARPGDTPYSGAQALSFHTQVQERRPSGPFSGSTGPGGDEPRVFELIKAMGNPFPDRISLGRAQNCDIVIRDASVSKLHGHFRDITSERASFTDAKSANGTYVAGERLVPGQVAVIERMMHISFGRIRLQLMSSADVYDSL